jgi:hypothetical protein
MFLYLFVSDQHSSELGKTSCAPVLCALFDAGCNTERERVRRTARWGAGLLAVINIRSSGLVRMVGHDALQPALFSELNAEQSQHGNILEMGGTYR